MLDSFEKWSDWEVLYFSFSSLDHMGQDSKMVWKHWSDSSKFGYIIRQRVEIVNRDWGLSKLCFDSLNWFSYHVNPRQLQFIWGVLVGCRHLEGSFGLDHESYSQCMSPRPCSHIPSKNVTTRKYIHVPGSGKLQTRMTEEGERRSLLLLKVNLSHCLVE